MSPFSPKHSSEATSSTPSHSPVQAVPHTHKRRRAASADPADHSAKKRKTETNEEHGTNRFASASTTGVAHTPTTAASTKRQRSPGCESPGEGPSTKRCRASPQPNESVSTSAPTQKVPHAASSERQLPSDSDSPNEMPPPVPSHTLTFIHLALKQSGVRLFEKQEMDDMTRDGCITLGQGAYGKCRFAVNPVTGEEVAIKAIYHDNSLAYLFVEAFYMHQLQTDGVLRLFGVCVETCELVTQYAGVTVDEYFSTPRPLNDKVSVLLQVARALQRVVQRFTHNDIKGDNVCINVTSQGLVATIIDFGLARLLGSQSPFVKKSRVRLKWVAPELQLHTQPTSEASEVFSLAVMTREVMGLQNGTPSMAPLALWVQNALRPNPDERPGLAEVVGLLEALLEEAS